MKKFYDLNHSINTITSFCNGMWLLKNVLMPFIMCSSVIGLHGQSGGWDAFGTNGTTGYNDWGSGVIQLLNTVNTGCAGAAIHETSAKYDPTSGSTFNQCYKVFFGCPGNDDIGSDTKGDGMAFSFSKCAYNINNGLACGGGLGYMGSCPQMITIEFDTWSSQGNTGFDATYGGGTSGNNDEIAIHRDGNASDAGRITSTNAGNLEDGLEHTVCITYTPGTRIMTVSIDGNTLLSYDMGPTYNLQTYFGAGGLNQTWSSGKFGATNPATVSNGANIAATVGGPLCPAGVVITSPANNTSFNSCPVGPINITATATPPAGNTVSYVEFFVDGVSIGTDNTAPHAISWNTPTNGNHALTAVSHYTPSMSTSTSPAVNITVGGGLSLTSTPPVIDGTIDASWGSFLTRSLTQGFNNPPDLAAYYKIAYDATYVYVLVDVTDDVRVRDGSGGTWEDDGVEIFIDIGNNKPTSYGANDYQYSFNWNSAAIIENKWGATAGVTFAQTNRVGGYIMEMRFPWATLGGGSPVPGTYIGFDVKINDDDDSGTRDNELSWYDGTFGAWNNPSLFGTLQFTSCDPLPVSMLTFSGKLNNDGVLLHWATASEVNNQKFIVERSTNLSNWEPIGEVKGLGNSSSEADYHFIDYAPVTSVVYYRLQQIDVDGRFAYTNVISIAEINGDNIDLLPNPFSDVLTVRCNVSGTVHTTIQDMVGRILYDADHESADGIFSVQPELSCGTYLVTVKTDTFIEQRKVIKK